MLPRVLPAVLALLIVGYFVFHTLKGERGVFALLHYEQEVAKAEAVRDGLRVERQSVEKRVSLLRPESLDLDMLEERARIILNYSHPDDVFVLPERDDQPAPVYKAPQSNVEPASLKR